MNLKAPPGVFDIIPNSPQKWRSSYLWHFVESKAKEVASLFGYLDIRTPIFERVELFKRGVGDNTDIVSKEMYTFIDKGERAMALRPEGTAPAIRAYIENNLHNDPTQQKLFYIAPMFRYERAQSGRYRQHHQFGVEALGSHSPLQDVEIIDLLFSFYKSIGLKDIELQINTLGNSEARASYRIDLVNYLEKYQHDLSEESKHRLVVNPLRILDSKDPKDQEILEKAPSLMNYLDKETLSHFEEVCNLIKSIQIPCKINPKLVRGLDYYNGVVFEVTTNLLGAQNSIGGGGRYDGLVKQLGGPAIPSCGFGTGLERVIQTLLAQNEGPSAPPGPLLYMIPLGKPAIKLCFEITHKLREKNIPAQMELTERKLSKAMQHANALSATFTAVVGDNELEKKCFPIKNMKLGTTEEVPFEKVEQYLNNFLE